MDKGMTMLDAEAGFVRKLLCFHMLLFMNRLLDYKYFRFLHAYKSSFASPERIGCTIQVFVSTHNTICNQATLNGNISIYVVTDITDYGS